MTSIDTVNVVMRVMKIKEGHINGYVVSTITTDQQCSRCNFCLPLSCETTITDHVQLLYSFCIKYLLNRNFGRTDTSFRRS